MGFQTCEEGLGRKLMWVAERKFWCMGPGQSQSSAQWPGPGWQGALSSAYRQGGQPSAQPEPHLRCVPASLGHSSELQVQQGFLSNSIEPGTGAGPERPRGTVTGMTADSDFLHTFPRREGAEDSGR